MKVNIKAKVREGKDLCTKININTKFKYDDDENQKPIENQIWKEESVKVMGHFRILIIKAEMVMRKGMKYDPSVYTHGYGYGYGYEDERFFFFHLNKMGY